MAVIGGKGGLAGHFSTAKEFFLLLGFFIDSLFSYHHHKWKYNMEKDLSLMDINFTVKAIKFDLPLAYQFIRAFGGGWLALWTLPQVCPVRLYSVPRIQLTCSFIFFCPLAETNVSKVLESQESLRATGLIS